MTGKIFNIKFCLLPIFALIVIIQSCSPVPLYNEPAYSMTVKLKVKSIDIMKKASEGYSKHVSEVDSLKKELRFAYEYAKGRPGKELITEQWETMMNPDRNLMGGFLRIWKEDLILSPIFVSEAQRVIGEAFDKIIGLESGKIQPSQLEEKK